MVLRYDDTSKNAYCSAYKAVAKGDFSCDPNFNVFQAGVVTRWTPVKNLTFSADLQYVRLDQNNAGTATLTPSAPKPTALYEFKDQNALMAQVRLQKNW